MEAADSSGHGLTGVLSDGAAWVEPGGRSSILSEVAWYRLGENDPGVAPGPAVSTRDIAGNKNMTLVGGPLYDTNVAPAATRTSSSYGLRFANGAWGTNALVSTAADNFGLELWVKPSTVAGDRIIAYNGHTGTSGWGLRLANGLYSVLFGGAAVIGSAPASINVWTHLALVRADGITTLYVDGVASATSGAAPFVPAGLFALATPPNAPGTALFDGWLDEVRVFTFGPGQFSTNDLLLKAMPRWPAVLTSVATGVGTNSATLNGGVSPNGLPTTAWFLWGTTTSYEFRTPAMNMGAGKSLVPLTSSLTGLLAGTLYHYRIVGDSSAGATYGVDQTITTLSLAPVIGDQFVSSITATSATLNASIHPSSLATAVWFAYGTNTDYGATNFFEDIGAGGSPVPVSASLTDLFAGMVYHYQVFAVNSKGLVSGGDRTFTTPLAAPAVATQPADPIGAAHATLNGVVTANGTDATVWFQYGSTSNYGNTTPPIIISATNLMAVAISNVLGPLTPSTEYHFQLVASNSTGSSRGEDLAFSTLPISAPTVITLPASNPTTSSAIANGSVDPNGVDTVAWFRWGVISFGWPPTTNYEHVTPPISIAGTNPITAAMSEMLSGLVQGRFYHFQLVASNSVGTSYGTNQTAAALHFMNMHSGLPAKMGNLIRCADFNNDGTLDVLNFTEVWTNRGNGTFAHSATVPPTVPGGAAVGDLDNDGYLDLVIGPQLWRNNHDATFTLVTNLLPNANAVVIADMDNDGWLDLIVNGTDDVYPGQPMQYRIWRNDGNWQFTKSTTSGLPPFGIGTYNQFTHVSAGDFDKDGRMDVFLSAANLDLSVGVWRNQDNGTFAKIIAAGQMRYSSFEHLTLNTLQTVADFNSDGQMDFLRVPHFYTIIASFTNNGQGALLLDQAAFDTESAYYYGFYPIIMSHGTVTAGDYDADGHMDFLVAGRTDSWANRVADEILLGRNMGGGIFTPAATLLPAAPVAAFGDFDRDGRLDLVLESTQNPDPVCDVWRNLLLASNAPPTTPTGLLATPTPSGPGVILSWTPATDAQTPIVALSYNVRVGITPGGSEIVSPQSDPVTGYRRIPQIGNAQQNLFAVLHLPPGTYYWSVQAIDSGFDGSPFAPEQTFTLRPVITAFAYSGSDQFRVEFNARAGFGYTLQASTDLIQWADVTNATPLTNGPFQFTVTGVSNPPARFFRLRWP